MALFDVSFLGDGNVISDVATISSGFYTPQYTSVIPVTGSMAHSEWVVGKKFKVLQHAKLCAWYGSNQYLPPSGHEWTSTTVIEWEIYDVPISGSPHGLYMAYAAATAASINIYSGAPDNFDTNDASTSRDGTLILTASLSSEGSIALIHSSPSSLSVFYQCYVLGSGCVTVQDEYSDGLHIATSTASMAVDYCDTRYFPKGFGPFNYNYGATGTYENDPLVQWDGTGYHTLDRTKDRLVSTQSGVVSFSPLSLSFVPFWTNYIGLAES